MDKNRIAGVVRQAKGVVKSIVGRVIGSAKLRAEGTADQAARRAQKALGKVKDAMSRPKQKTPCAELVQDTAAEHAES
jgi:uncharacterized protein YjbJ (UPF0337 family)